jgi:hypothetical protein
MEAFEREESLATGFKPKQIDERRRRGSLEF